MPEAVLGLGPVAEVEHQTFLFGFDEVIAGDGAMGVEKLISDVGEDEGAARGDGAFGDELEEAGEKLIDVDVGVKFGELGEEFGGEVLRVVLRLGGSSDQSGMAETQMAASVEDGETAAVLRGFFAATRRGG